jgi:hypothetical protein
MRNPICIHPGNNATCSQDGAISSTSTLRPTPTHKTCEQCFTSLLNPMQIADVIFAFGIGNNLEDLCTVLGRGMVAEAILRADLTFAGIEEPTQTDRPYYY